MSPVLRRMSKSAELDLTVAYCSLRGAEAGYDPEFAATVKWDTPLLEGFTWKELANRGSGSDSFFGICNPGAWRLIRRGAFDAVLCLTGYRCATFWIACLAAKSSRTAFLFGTDATTLISRDAQSWKRSAKAIFWPWLFSLADQVIVPSSGSRDLMFSLGFPQERVTLTPYSVDNEWWMAGSAKVDRRGVRTGWGVPESDTLVLFCAKLQTWKRPLDLLHAFAKSKISNAHLVYAGEGPLRSALESEARRLGVAGQVRFLGFVNQTQLPAVYTAADVMVLPSEYEPFAVVVNEAICCGCPVIVSDRVGAARDLVTPVAPEMVYPCGDIDALATALRLTLSDRARLAATSAALREHIRTWSPKENIDATIGAVRAAVSRVRPLPRGPAHVRPAAPSSAAGPQKLRE
jgi:glycosyltransferase involved in cell wall biosynthesis